MAEELCTVNTDDLDLETIISGDFGDLQDDIKFTGFAGFGPDLTSVNVVGPVADLDRDEGLVGGMWFLEQVRLADGFRITFQFDVEGGRDGLAFIIQNDDIVNVGAGGGPNLGFFGGVKNSLAIGFDTCLQRGQDDDCREEAIFITTQKGDDAPVEIFRQDEIAANLNFEVKPAPVTCVVTYLVEAEDVFRLIINLNGQDEIDIFLPESLETIMDSKFGFVGFTGSRGERTSVATANVKNFEFVQMNSLSRLASLDRQVVNFGEIVQFKLIAVDTCNDAVTPENDVSLVEARLISKVADQDDVPGNVTFNIQDNSFDIAFVTPFGFLDTFDLEVKFDGILAQKNPVANVVETITPEAGLQPLGIGLLSALIVVLVIGVAFMVNRLNRYRRKLNEHSEDIQYGRTKKVIDEIDKTVDYTVNPMVAPLDKLKERLAMNLETIKRLQDGQKDAEDSDYTVEQLQLENQQLREEMNQLKREKELAEAGNRISANLGGRVGARGQDKQGFDQESA